MDQVNAGSMFHLGRERAASEKLRPWTMAGSITSDAGLLDRPSVFELSAARSSADTLPNLLRQASDGTVDLCIQSVDLLSTDSSMSEPLTDEQNDRPE